MKPSFDKNNRATYADQKKSLEQKADAIEKKLNTPANASPVLRPKGMVKSQSHANARTNMRQQRVDIIKQLEQMKKETQQRAYMAKRHRKVKGL